MISFWSFSFWFSLYLRYYYALLIPLYRSLNKKTENHNIPDIAGYRGRQLGFLYPSGLLSQTLANFLSISIYTWRIGEAHIFPIRSAAWITDFEREVRYSPSLPALSVQGKPFDSTSSYLKTLLCSMLIDCHKGHWFRDKNKNECSSCGQSTHYHLKLNLIRLSH